MTMQGEMRLTFLNETSDCDAAHMQVKGDMLIRLSIKRSSI